MNKASLIFVAAGGDRSAVTLSSDVLASGADGQIFMLKGLPKSVAVSAVAKLYHPDRCTDARRKKLEAMLGNIPDLPDIQFQGQSYVQLAWPLGLLYEAGDENNAGDATGLGAFVGFAMPAVDLQRSTTLDLLLSEKTRRAYKLPEHYGYQLAAARNVALMIAELHAHGHHVVDLKPVNINVYTDTLFVAMLDCDGFSIAADSDAAGEPFPAHQYTADYIAPEAWQTKQPPEALGEAQDRFALAVILFRLLIRGLHPFQGIPSATVSEITTNQDRIAKGLYAYERQPHPQIKPSPWSIHRYLPDELRELFDQAFTSQRRPSAAEWVKVLTPYTDVASGQLLACPDNAEHAMYIGHSCGLCMVDKQRIEVAAKPLPEPARVRRETAPSPRRARRSAPQRTTSGTGRTTSSGNPHSLSNDPVMWALWQCWQWLEQLYHAVARRFSPVLSRWHLGWSRSGPSRWLAFAPLPVLVAILGSLLFHPTLERFFVGYPAGQSAALGRLPKLHDITDYRIVASPDISEAFRSSRLPTWSADQLTEWRKAIDSGDPERLHALLDKSAVELRTANEKACCELVRFPSGEGNFGRLKMQPLNSRLPLHYAIASRASLAIIELLIEAGFDPEQQDGDGLSAYHVAAYYRDDAVLMALLTNYEPEQRLRNPTYSIHQLVALSPGRDRAEAQQMINALRAGDYPIGIRARRAQLPSAELLLERRFSNILR